MNNEIDDVRDVVNVRSAQAGPAPDVPRSVSDVLRGLTEPEFRAGLVEAQRRRDESAATFANYRMWFDRLEPYLTRDPGATIEDALVRYRADCANANAAREAGRS